MKKNGFTLIELLAVIVILAIVALIATVSVRSVLSDSKNSLSDTQKKNIEQAAKTYYLKEGMSINNTCISVSSLIEKGYIEGKSVKDPKNSEEMTGYVKITYAANQYSYTYQEESCNVCSIEKQNDSKYSIGDVVTCNIGTTPDKFYVIEDAEIDADSIQVLTEMNIHTTEYRQSEDAGTIAFSTTKYWDDSISSEWIYKPLPQYGTTYPTYVYDDNSLVKPIVDEYVKYLNTKLTNASGKLLTRQQMNKLNEEYGYLTTSKWAYSPIYWAGYAMGAHDLGSTDYDEIHGGWSTAHDPVSFSNGVRPVITISTSDIG